MKRALLTGQSGFVGKNIRPVLEQHFEVLAPMRAELDLRDTKSTEEFLRREKIDIVFHCANPNPVKNQLSDHSETMLADSLRIFFNLHRNRDKYGKMIYLGSGAEYDKSLEISNVREEMCFRSPPKDIYGLAKYTMNLLASQSQNIYNLCLFACYGPWDHSSKFITHCIRCCLRGESITIRQDCRFDYIHVSDLGRMMVWMGEHDPQYKMYNVSGCEPLLLSEIAEEVRKQMESGLPVQILKPGYNREYTADGTRFWEESKLSPLMNIQNGIAQQIQWEREHYDEKKSS